LPNSASFQKLREYQKTTVVMIQMQGEKGRTKNKEKNNMHADIYGEYGMCANMSN
jgi:hypothetical protein